MKNQFLLIIGAIVLTCNLQAQFQKSYHEFPGITNRYFTDPVKDQNNLKKDLPFYPVKRNLFTPDSMVWHWDTIVCYDLNNVIYRISETFNGYGGVLERLTEAWLNNTWKNYSRKTHTYDANGNDLVYLEESWNNNSWEGKNRHSFSYDSNGNMVLMEWEIGQSNTWQKISQYSMIFDTNGNIDSMYVNKGENNIWVNNIRVAYSCDINGNILTDQRETWSDTCWILSYMDTYTYDGNGNQTISLIEIWQNNNWENFSMGTMTYDTNGNYLTSLNELWQNNAWNNSSIVTWTYDGNNYLASLLDQEWVNNTWNNFNSILYLNDSSGNMLVKVWRDWQSGWLNNYKLTYTYDLFGNSITGKYDSWETPGIWLPGIGNLVIFSNHQYDFGIDIELNRYTAIINPIILDVSPKEPASRFVVFPNPAHSQIRIKTDKNTIESNMCISIFTLEGRLLTTRPLTDMDREIDISNLPNGIYIVKLTNNEKTVVAKLVKE